MTKRYINVEKNRYYPPSKEYWNIPEVEPDNIIYFAHFPDTTYDNASENMGFFLEMVYLDGDEVKAEWRNPGDWDKIGAFVEKVKDKFTKRKVLRSPVYVGYFNKEMLPDIKIEDDSLIYKDKYRVDLSS